MFFHFPLFSIVLFCILSFPLHSNLFFSFLFFSFLFFSHHVLIIVNLVCSSRSNHHWGQRWLRDVQRTVRRYRGTMHFEPHTHTYTYIRTHKHPHIRTHTHTHTQKHIHTHTYTYIDTYLYMPRTWWWQQPPLLQCRTTTHCPYSLLSLVLHHPFLMSYFPSFFFHFFFLLFLPFSLINSYSPLRPGILLPSSSNMSMPHLLL